jgi:hypothetical protein
MKRDCTNQMPSQMHTIEKGWNSTGALQTTTRAIFLETGKWCLIVVWKNS